MTPAFLTPGCVCAHGRAGLAVRRTASQSVSQSGRLISTYSREAENSVNKQASEIDSQPSQAILRTCLPTIKYLMYMCAR